MTQLEMSLSPHVPHCIQLGTHSLFSVASLFEMQKPRWWLMHLYFKQHFELNIGSDITIQHYNFFEILKVILHSCNVNHLYIYRILYFLGRFTFYLNWAVQAEAKLLLPPGCTCIITQVNSIEKSVIKNKRITSGLISMYQKHRLLSVKCRMLSYLPCAERSYIDN